MRRPIAYILLSLTLALLLAACEVEHDMSTRHLDHEARLVVYCMPSARDTTIIQVSHSLPLNGNYGNWRDAHQLLEQCQISYKVNGREQTVHATSVLGQRVGTVPLGAYYVVCSQQAGDRIELSVSHEGYPSASAETVIPAPAAIGAAGVREVRRIDVDGNRESYYQLTAPVTDATPDADYYAVQVEMQTFSSNAARDGVDTLATALEIATLDEPLLNPLSDADEEFLFENSFLGQFYIFDDKLLSPGAPYVLHLDLPTWQVADPVRIVFYRLSPEYFKFLKSVNDAANNGMAEYGLSTISPMFSNVRGGLGFVGGYSCAATEWVEPVITLPDDIVYY